jgi:hypothetical protein
MVDLTKMSDNIKGLLICVAATIIFVCYNLYYDELSRISGDDHWVRAFIIVTVFAMAYDSGSVVVKKEYRTRWLIAGIQVLLISLVIRLFWFTDDAHARSLLSVCVSLILMVSSFLRSRRFLYDDSGDE